MIRKTTALFRPMSNRGSSNFAVRHLNNAIAYMDLYAAVMRTATAEEAKYQIECIKIERQSSLKVCLAYKAVQGGLLADESLDWHIWSQSERRTARYVGEVANNVEDMVLGWQIWERERALRIRGGSDR
ncbi:hypothetical protein HHI36_003896 [Cryptolaemus montrouzieri]|uniref:Uncharacterized protein n=1 Tax=Cryptolaemus montrouzieri TaxID=559131 RepID=A0ABD2NPV3_9CUCU